MGSQRLEIRQGQSLVMTPQLQQAIKLLQLSNLELAEYVEGELERNPLLEREEGKAEQGEDGPERESAADTPGDPEAADQKLSDDGAAGNAADDLDTSYDNLYSDGPAERDTSLGPTVDYAGQRGRSGGFDGDDSGLENSLDRPLSLRDHLMEQLQIAVHDPGQRLIGAYLVDLVDEAGYVRGDLAEIADALGTREAEIEETLRLLQTFEPTGVMARDLSECLALQLKERNRFDPAMEALLQNLDLIVRQDLEGLAKICGVDQEDVRDMIRELRTLEPKPGLRFGSEPVQPVVPDVFVRKSASGAWTVELNSETLPRVLVNTRYYTEINAKVAGQKDAKDDKAYLTDCLNNANWLVKSLDQRAKTILKVAGEIVRQQDGFLAHGIRHLRPMNLRVVADAIAMHESTVSRVTANKFMATPRGVFELKYFFTPAIASASGGEAHSAEAVRHRIKELIDAEDAKKVLSDDQLVARLKADGVDIARRTVAKYREAMGIPSSVQRRRLKKMPA